MNSYASDGPSDPQTYYDGLRGPGKKETVGPKVLDPSSVTDLGTMTN